MSSQINGKTQLLGLLGWPVSHTKSPKIHNTLAKHHNQNVVYVPLPVHPDNIELAIKGLPALGFVGVNVTVPHKKAVIPFLDEIDLAAQAIGAVNTIKFSLNSDGSSLSIGYNTDGLGFAQDLANHQIQFKERDSIVIGAGGSARAIVFTLLEAGGCVNLLARRKEQAQRLKDEMSVYISTEKLFIESIEMLPAVASNLDAPLIVNCTPVGMSPDTDVSIWATGQKFPKASTIYDLIYNPAETLLMKQAQEDGCQSINGMGMLIGQAAEAFRIWTNVFPNLEFLNKIFD